MNLDFRRMMQQELQFVRAYSIALKQRFSVFVSALHVMRAPELEVKCPVVAASVAHGLDALHIDFERKLAELAEAHDFRLQAPKIAHPTVEEITQIVQVSFFKLLEPANEQKAANDLGWFSGHPLDWEHAWDQLSKQKPPTAEKFGSALLNALANMFKIKYAKHFKPPVGEPYEEPDEDDDWYDQNDYEN